MLQSPDVALYRQGFRRTAGGVWVVTAAHGGQRSGLTATSVVSLSADPAELMVSVNTDASSLPLISQARQFGVNLLGADQRAIADRFAGRGGCKGDDRYQEAPWVCTPEGVWLLASAPVTMACDVVEQLWRRTHVILIGRISAMRVAPATTQPLLYADGRYAELMAE